MTLKKSFLNCFCIEDKDIISITGAGGKTSLMFNLALEAKNNNKKVLIATTTKIFKPKNTIYDYIDLTGNLFDEIKIKNTGIYLNGKYDNKTDKLLATDISLLNMKKNKFDIVIIEADGAKRKPLKGWNEFEPVIPEFTTKTIGVIDIQTIGKTADETVIHRLNIFSELTGIKIGQRIKIEHLKKIIFHKNGLFKNAKGEKILFINKVETVNDKKNVDLLTKNIKLKYLAGSLKNGEIYAQN